MRSALITVAAVALVGAFLSLVVCISITPVRNWTQELAACRGADRVQRDVSNATPVPGRDGKARPTTTFELVCTYSDGRIEGVGNDRAVIGGIGVSLVLGLLAGALAGLLAAVPRRRTT